MDEYTEGLMDNNSNSTDEEKPSRAKTVWLVLVVLALIASNTAWGLFFFKQQTELQATITELKTEKAQLQKELADAKSASKEDDGADEWREIPELGLKYIFNDDTEKLTYAYHGSTEGGSIHWSTKSLSDKSEGDNSCDGYDGSIISWNTEDDTYSTKNKRVGSLTVYSVTPDGGDMRPEVCKDTKLNNDLKAAEKKAFDSLKAID